MYSVIANLSVQGVLDYTGMETRQTLSRMLTIANTFEKLFTPTLNGVAVSVRYAFSMPVILHAELNGQLQRMHNK